MRSAVYRAPSHIQNPATTASVSSTTPDTTSVVRLKPDPTSTGRGGTAGWGIAAPRLPEFWAVVTHPAAAGKPSSPRQAAGFLRALTAAGAEIWLHGPGFGERLVRLAEDLGVTGPRVFDVQIALVAFEGGATELWTHDRAFVTIPGLAVRDPLA